MEDVVLHYKPGSAAGLSGLLKRTEKLLEPFPCRIPPVFTPWSPSTTDRHLPIRPAKPPPVITTISADLVTSDSRVHIGTAQNQIQKTEACSLVAERHHNKPPAKLPENPQEPKDAASVSEKSNCLLSEREVTRLPPEKHKDCFLVKDSPTKRSWSVFTQKGVLPQNSLSSLSKQFHHMVSVHGLHLHQRAKWVIGQHNCGAVRDIEQVWRVLSRCARSFTLPTCNANIQRGRAEIWVFCDILHCEQVGHFLKDKLQLSGRIALSVHRLGNIFSM